MEKAGKTTPPNIDSTLPKVLCPLTGSRVVGKRIKPHSLQLKICKNGSLYARCSVHDVRLFISNMLIVEDLIGETADA
jgi:hypothetical protein